MALVQPAGGRYLRSAAAQGYPGLGRWSRCGRRSVLVNTAESRGSPDPDPDQAAAADGEVADQIFQIATATVDGDRVTLEVKWTAVVQVDVPDRPAGTRIRSRLAVFLHIREGRICARHNGDAYLPD